MHNTPPADAALLREWASEYESTARDKDAFNEDAAFCADIRTRAARLRALAAVLERSEQKCSQCGLPHSVDTSLPSDTWNQIAKPHEMLCPLCIDERLVKAGIRARAQFYCVGEALESQPYPVRRIVERPPLYVEDDASPSDSAAR